MHARRRWILRSLVAATVAAAVGPAAAAAQTPSDTFQLNCLSCHPGVHATMVGKGPQWSQACSVCHERAHEAVKALFTGVAADPVLHPDRMFSARVGCRECHTDSALAATAPEAKLAAVRRACESCHGPSFGFMLPQWNAAMSRRTQATQEYVAAARSDGRLAGQANARGRLDSAQADVALVQDGTGLHNILGADALLRSAVRKVGAAYSGAGLPAPSPPRLGPDPATVSCAYCHYGVETVSDTLFGQTFSHAVHVVTASVPCTRCHSNADYFRAGGHALDPAHGKTTVTAAACSECHHVTSGVACATCHTRQELASNTGPVTLPLHLEPPGAPTSRSVAFQHDYHAGVACTSCHTSRESIATVAACSTCHEAHHQQAADCTLCHGTNLLAVHTAAEHFACAQCHARQTLELLTGDRTFCLTCHVDRRGHNPSRECSQCHLQMSPAEVRARILGIQP